MKIVRLADHHLDMDSCWMCGAADGAYDGFLDEHLTLCFCEPTDGRFPTQLGFQIMCSACSIGSKVTPSAL